MANSVTTSHKSILDIDIYRASVFLGIVATVALKNWDVVVYAAQALMILAVGHKCAKRASLPNVAIYVAFNGFFAFWCLLSAFWAINPVRVMSALIGVVQFVIIGTSIVLFASSKRDIEFLFDCLAWAGVVLIVVLVILTPRSDWIQSMQAISDAASSENRIGRTVGYHPNALGRICAVCAVLWLYKYRNSGKRRRCLIPIAAFVVILLFTKSRLSIIILAVCMASYCILSSRSALKRVVITVLVIAVLAILSWGLLNIPTLYDLAGFRFAAMFGLTGSVDASTTTRGDMTRVAFELFSRNPILGVGFANYAVHYFAEYSGWAMTYAHNNYAELLADLGIFGTASYYAIPLWCFVTLIKYRCRANNHDLHIALIALAICLLVSDYASISYTNDFIQILWAAVFAYCQMLKQERRENCAVKTMRSKMQTTSAFCGGRASE